MLSIPILGSLNMCSPLEELWDSVTTQMDKYLCPSEHISANTYDSLLLPMPHPHPTRTSVKGHFN